MRKKTEASPIPKTEAKKREKPLIIKPSIFEPIPEILPTPPKTKKSDDKYVRLALNAKIDDKKQIQDRVLKGELKLAYFASDGDLGYHYYLVL